jgi:hypothetical protein
MLTRVRYETVNGRFGEESALCWHIGGILGAEQFTLYGTRAYEDYQKGFVRCLTLYCENYYTDGEGLFVCGGWENLDRLLFSLLFLDVLPSFPMYFT